MPAVAPQLIGREDELRAIERLLDARDDLPGTVLLHGEAGIGKTSVLLAGIDAAVEREYRMLSCRASEAETTFGYAGLSDLLGGVVDEVIPALPPIQRRALEAALLLGESAAEVDERAVAAAFLAALSSLTSERPLCVAVDDVQWLDAESLAALRFSLARLENEPVATLVTARGEPPPWVRRAVPDTRLATVGVDGLSLGAMHELFRTRLDLTVARPTLIRLWETSGGNPFYALELATALRRRGGTITPGEELPIPADLDELVHARLDGLDSAALEVARVVALAAEPTSDIIAAVLGPTTDSGLDALLEARILEPEGERLRFTHPLLGSAVRAHQMPSHRRSLHARLAEVVPTAEERARHLAIATRKPNGEIAAVLEDAAASADARGAPAASAELAEHALRLTPLDDVVDARRRLFLAADRHHVVGDSARAVELLSRAQAQATPGADRAAVLTQLAGIQALPRDATALYREALSEAEGDDRLESTIHCELASLMAWSEGVERGLAHAELAVHAASHTDDVALRCCALAVQGDWHLRAGRGIDRTGMDDAVAVERALPEWPIDGGPTEWLGLQLVWALDLEPARQLLLELCETRRARDEGRLEAWALWFLGLLEWRAGNWDEADRYAARFLEIRVQFGPVLPPEEFLASILAAHQGRIDDARAKASGALDATDTEGESPHGWVLGFVELSLGEPAAALPYLMRTYEARNAFTLEPGMRLELGDLLESLIASGALGEADEILAMWEPRAAAVDRAWALAILARCRGLLLAARGDLAGAFACFEQALAEHARDVDPFTRARTLLAQGRTQRRAKKRGAARATLASALAEFERLGAPLWAEQTRAEVARIGGRAPSRGELTEAERRIALLVAEGGTNREVAAALFLTEHSVETALTLVYRKLGVRSRAELARRYRTET